MANRVLPPNDKGSRNIAAPTDPNQDTPIWCFRRLRKGYTFAEINDPKIAKRLTDALEKRRCLSWAELLKRDPERDGVVSWSKAKLRKEPPPEYKNESNFLKFYAGKGQCRVVGFRNGRVFEVVWIDCKFDVTSH